MPTRSHLSRLALQLSSLSTLLLAACPTTEAPPTSGSFTALTYNVAGLPDGLNDDQHPETNIPKISPKLNAYELVLVQEDFAYTQELREDLEHPYESYPLEHEARFVNDGLNRFSWLPFDPELTRVRWAECNGTTGGSGDCLANKGFSLASHELAEGVTLTVVNLHAEAGGGPDDVAARTTGYEQLAAYLGEHHAGEALLVAGDTNLHGFDPDDEPILERFLEDAALTDACRSLECGEEHIDRFLFRSSDELELTLSGWAVAEEMVDQEGAPLSDHPAIRVDVAWRVPSSDP